MSLGIQIKTYCILVTATDSGYNSQQKNYLSEEPNIFAMLG